MTDNEVNKIIAEFMGWEIIHDGNALSIDGGWSHLPCHSLDTLVPVWEKLGLEIGLHQSEKLWFAFCWKKDATDETKKEFMGKWSDMPQQTAAHATAKAILELKDE